MLEQRNGQTRNKYQNKYDRKDRKKQEKKSIQISLRISESDKKILDKLTNMGGLSQSDLISGLLNNGNVVVITQAEEAVHKMVELDKKITNILFGKNKEKRTCSIMKTKAEYDKLKDDMYAGLTKRIVKGLF